MTFIKRFMLAKNDQFPSALTEGLTHFSTPKTFEDKKHFFMCWILDNKKGEKAGAALNPETLKCVYDSA